VLETVEDLWLSSVLASASYHQKAEDERRLAWIHFHDDMSRLHSQLAAEHQRKAADLREPPARASVCEEEGREPYLFPESGGAEGPSTMCSKEENS
jgi:hypothetical protein